MTIYIALIISLLLSAFFSGMEIAFISSNKLRIELNKESDNLGQQIIAQFNEDAPNFITTLLIGNNIALIFFSGFMANIFTAEFLQLPNDSAIVLLSQTIITTIVVLIFGEFLPKLVFRIAPYQFLLAFAIPLKYLIYLPLKYVSQIFTSTSKFFIKKIMGGNYDETKDEFTSVDLEYYIKDIAAGQNTIDDDDELNAEIFERALYLKEIKIKECMVPRTEIHAIDMNSSIEELREKFLESKVSRVMIYDETIDNIEGYVHHLDVVMEKESLKEMIYDLPVVPESMSARDLLTKFTKEHKSIACVVDEYGGTSGIVTLEDLIEEIFGEIHDEHDEEAFIDKKLSADEYLFSSRLEIDYLNEKYELDIPEGDYETLGGYVVVNHENIPQEGEAILIDNFEIKVVTAEENKLETLQLKRLSED